MSLVDGLRLDNFTGVEQLVIDVDVRALGDSIASEKMTISEATRGWEQEENLLLLEKQLVRKDSIRKALEGVDLIFFWQVRRRNGGPLKSPSLQEKQVPLFCFCFMPFSWEKSRRTSRRLARRTGNLPMP